MNTKIIEGLKAMNEGFNLVINGLSEELNSLSTSLSTTVEETVEKTSKKSSKKAPEPDKEEVKSDAEFTEDELNEMSYNELKKLAKDKGITATGNRKELVKKLLSGDVSETEDEEAPEEEAPKTKTPAKKSAKKPEPVEDEEEADESDDEAEDEPEEEDSIEKQVNEIVEDMSDDELRELLESVDISSKGKRQALISKLITAVSEGVISLEDEADESDEEEAETEPEETEDESDESADVTENMTKKRKKAYKELCDETSEQFENGEITRDDLIDFINEYHGTKDKMKKKSDEDLISEYLEISAMLIDDDGEIVEEGAYYINDEPYCCGHPLTYDKKKKQYVCEHCGAEYEAE